MKTKLLCEKISVLGKTHKIQFRALPDQPENASFANETPTIKAAASLSLSITNPEAQGVYVPGKSYLVEITLAPEPAPTPAEPFN